MNLANIFITLVIALFPVYFWAYALRLLGENSPDVRLKFWTGVFSGLVSVGAVFVFFKYYFIHDFFCDFFGIFLRNYRIVNKFWFTLFCQIFASCELVASFGNFLNFPVSDRIFESDYW